MTRADRATRRERYESVCRIVEYQTGGPDQPLPPACRESTVVRLRTYTGDEPDAVRRALQAAVENGDLWRIRDARGHTRYVRYDVESLRDLSAVVGGRPDTDVEFLGRVNAAIRECSAEA